MTEQPNLPPCLRETPETDRMACLTHHNDCWKKRTDALRAALNNMEEPTIKLFQA